MIFSFGFYFLFNALIFLSTGLAKPYLYIAHAIIPLFYFMLTSRRSHNPLQDTFFILFLFFLAIFFEIFVPAIGVYQHGLVNLPGFDWPATWTASFWLCLVSFYWFDFSPSLKYRGLLALPLALVLYVFYFYTLENYDLVFLNRSSNESSLLFIASYTLFFLVFNTLKGHVRKKKL